MLGDQYYQVHPIQSREGDIFKCLDGNHLHSRLSLCHPQILAQGDEREDVASTAIILDKASVHTLQCSPSPLLSMVISVASESIEGHDDPLLQAALKRQLVGLTLLWSLDDGEHGITSRIVLNVPPTNTNRKLSRTWKLTVQSMTTREPLHNHRQLRTGFSTPPKGKTHTGSSNSVVLGLILPSTRITFRAQKQKHSIATSPSELPASLRDITDASNKVTNLTDRTTKALSNQLLESQLASSPTAQTLVETITLIRRIAATGTNAHNHEHDSNTKHDNSTIAKGPNCDVTRCFLLSGSPGTGKTHAVRLAVQWALQQQQQQQSPHSSTRTSANALCHLISLQGSDLMAGVGSSADAAAALEREFLRAVRLASDPSSERGKNSGNYDNRTGRMSASVSGYQDKEKRNENVPISILFLDECDALLSVDVVAAMMGMLLDRMSTKNFASIGSGSGGSEYEIDRAAWMRLIVVAATNRVDAIPESLKRPGRFERELMLAPPTCAERVSILHSLWQQMMVETSISSSVASQDEDLSILMSPAEIQHIANVCVGYVPADLAALVRHVVMSRFKDEDTTRPPHPPDPTASKSNLLPALFQNAMAHVGASALRDAALSAPPQSLWSDVAGDPGGAKTAMKQAIEWPRTKSKAFAALGLTPPRGILLHGPPGCAKTTLARAAAGAAGVAFVSFSPADVYSSSYVGEAESVVRRAFTLARSAAPCILFFDEIDAILGSEAPTGGAVGPSMSRGASAEARVLSTFLNEMDGVDGSWNDGVMVLGATNRPSTLDAALLRPGRFDKIIYVPAPDYEGRRSILVMQCASWTVDAPMDFDELAREEWTGDMTGAEIVGACREAAMAAFRFAMSKRPPTEPRMNQSYLEKSLKQVVPLLSRPGVRDEYLYFENNRRANR